MSSRADEESGPPEGGREVYSSITDASARAALDRLLADAQFHASDRNRRFLRFVAEKTLAGGRSQIKAYSIAVDVFGRGTEFDSTLDPIVRIEATRLRAALNAYYAGPGRNEEVEIRIPKGGYAPIFVRTSPRGPVADGLSRTSEAGADPPSPVKEPATRGLRLPKIWKSKGFARLSLLLLAIVAISAFVVLRERASHVTSPPIIIVEGGQPTADEDITGQITTGFARALGLALSRFDGLRVLNLPYDLSLSAAIDKLDAGKKVQRPVYVLATSVRERDQVIRFWWNLKDARTGETVWADIADRSVSTGIPIPVEDEVAGKVATVIGQPQGLIASRAIEYERSYPTKGYGCILRARAYYLVISETLHHAVRDCLEQTVATSPDYSDAWAMLAFVYLDEDRNNFNRRSSAEDALNRALRSAQRAAEISPSSETAQEALAAVYYRRGDFDIAFAAGRRALEINPHNPELMSLVGTRLFARGQWDEGAALVREAFDQVLVVPPLDRVTLVLDAYRKHDYAAALEQAQLIDLPNYYASPLLRAAIYGQLGNAAEAQKSLQALLALRPNYAAEMRTELRSRHYTEELIDMLADGLRMAGLPVQ
jgi:adenylate cyclase